MRHSMRLILPAIFLALTACDKSDTSVRADGGGTTVQVPQASGETATTIHLTVQGGPHAGTYGTEQFLMTVGFGELMKEGYSEHNQHREEHFQEQGSGTIRVDDRKTGGKVTFKGKTGDGVGLEGSIDCHEMMRSEG